MDHQSTDEVRTSADDAPIRLWLAAIPTTQLSRKRKYQARPGLVDALRDLKDIVDSGECSPNDIYNTLTENLGAWVTQAQELAAAKDCKSRRLNSTSTEHSIASRDFLMVHMQMDLPKLPENANKAILMGAPIKHRGDDWMMVAWKGMGVFAPVRVAYWMRQFVIHGIAGEQEQAWTIRTVRDFFRLGAVLTAWNLQVPEEHGPTFIRAEGLDAVLARVDKLLLYGTTEAITVHDLLSRVGSVLELTGTDQDMDWELRFTRYTRYFHKRCLELVKDDMALEAIIGPMSTWCITPHSNISDDKHEIDDDEMFEL